MGEIAATIDSLRTKCAELQATTPQLDRCDTTTVDPEVRPLVERAEHLESLLSETRERIQRRSVQKAKLETACAVEAQSIQRLSRQVATLQDIYDLTDARMQDLPASDDGGPNPEVAVLALVGCVL